MKSNEWKRLHSHVYHNAEHIAERNGLGHASAKEAAREATAKAKRMYDKKGASAVQMAFL